MHSVSPPTKGFPTSTQKLMETASGNEWVHFITAEAAHTVGPLLLPYHEMRPGDSACLASRYSRYKATSEVCSSSAVRCSP